MSSIARHICKFGISGRLLIWCFWHFRYSAVNGFDFQLNHHVPGVLFCNDSPFTAFLNPDGCTADVAVHAVSCLSLGGFC